MKAQSVCAICLSGMLFVGTVHVPLQAETADDGYLIYWQRRAPDEQQHFFPSIMRTDGTVVIEDIAAYYPPVEPDARLWEFSYSPSLRWISVTTYAQRPEMYTEFGGRVFLIDTLTDTVLQLSPSDMDSRIAQWAPTQDRDLLTFGVNRDLEGFLGFSFYDPLSTDSSNVQFTSSSPALSLDKVRNYTWSSDGRRLFFSTLQNRMPEMPLLSYLTVNRDGSDPDILYVDDTADPSADPLPYVGSPKWIDEGIVTFCDRDASDLCVINVDSVAVQPFFPFDRVSSAENASLRLFTFSSDERSMYFYWYDYYSDENGRTVSNYRISRWDRDTDQVYMLAEGPMIAWGPLVYLPELPPDILDGTRPRWAERAEATAPGG